MFIWHCYFCIVLEFELILTWKFSHCSLFCSSCQQCVKAMVVGEIAKPPSFDGGRRFVLKAMSQTRKQVLNFADPVIQKQQRLLKSLPAVRLQRHYEYLMTSVACNQLIFVQTLIMCKCIHHVHWNKHHEMAKDSDSARILAIRCRAELLRRGMPIPLIVRWWLMFAATCTCWQKA